MGMYTALQFECLLSIPGLMIVQHLHRGGDWSSLSELYPEESWLKEWASFYRSDFIPISDNMVRTTLEESREFAGDGHSTLNENRWRVLCSLRNYSDENAGRAPRSPIGRFLAEVLPRLIMEPTSAKTLSEAVAFDCYTPEEYQASITTHDIAPKKWEAPLPEAVWQVMVAVGECVQSAWEDGTLGEKSHSEETEKAVANVKDLLMDNRGQGDLMKNQEMRRELLKAHTALKKLTAWWDRGAAFSNKLEAEQFALQSIKEIEGYLKKEPDGERMGTPTVVESKSWKVWAIQVLRRGNGTTWKETYAVSAESEYGAIKRYCGSRSGVVLYVSVIPGREPQYPERRIEGRVDFEFPEDATGWIYT